MCAENGTDGKALAANGKASKGQVVELRFRAPRQGKYDLTLYVMSGTHADCRSTLLCIAWSCS